MGVKLATTCLSSANSSSFSHTFASAISSPWTKRIGTRSGGAVAAAMVSRYVHRLEKPGYSKSWCFDYYLQKKRTPRITSTCRANVESFSDEEFSKSIHELSLRFKLSDSANESNIISQSLNEDECMDAMETPPFPVNSDEHPWLEIEQGSHDWPGQDEIGSAIVERKANSVDLPLSLRIIKKKLQWKEGFREAGESAYCSVKKAFSSMVFIIQELHSFNLQMREALLYEDLQGILSRVQQEIHASFVWLFQRIFSHTPTLMVYVMILLANFTVCSIGHNTAIAATAFTPPSTLSSTTTVEAAEFQDQKHQKIDLSAIKTSSVSSSSGKTVSIGGINGGGGKARPVANGTGGGDGKFDQSSIYSAVLPDGVSQLSSMGTAGDAESLSIHEIEEKGGAQESTLWNSVSGEVIDHETMTDFVSAKIETENIGDYFKTDLLYQTSLSQDPHNPLLLANYAQFLYQVAQDNQRAEDYFKRATAIEPPDPEAYSKYATFLWKAKNDLCAAEETYLEAISAEPSNSYYAANYAHFLWNTGAEDTCYPLDNSA